MIIGTCPYDGCEEALWIPIADPAPQYERHQCEGCEGWIWTYHSRLDPWSMTEKDFLTEYTVDEATKSISEVAP